MGVTKPLSTWEWHMSQSAYICRLIYKAAAQGLCSCFNGFSKTGSVPPAIENKNSKEMLQSVNFYLILFMLAMGAFSGLMSASNASPIGQRYIWANCRGLAAGYVSLIFPK